MGELVGSALLRNMVISQFCDMILKSKLTNHTVLSSA